MRKLIAPLALAALLTGCAAATPTPASSVTWSAPAVLTQALDQDAQIEAHAWEIFEHGGGASKLRVNPDRPFKVEFMAATTEYPKWADANDAIVPGKDGRWYWFHATYLD
jgi:hypothetical protein